MAQKRKARKPLSTDELRKSMSTALRELETIFMDSNIESETRIKAINSLSSLANNYHKLTEKTEVQQKHIPKVHPQLRKKDF